MKITKLCIYKNINANIKGLQLLKKLIVIIGSTFTLINSHKKILNQIIKLNKYKNLKKLNIVSSTGSPYMHWFEYNMCYR